MPTQAALVTMVSLVDKFEDSASFRYALYWFLQASRFGRYSGSGATSLEEDLRDIAEATTLVDAVHRLLRRFSHSAPMTTEDFMRDSATVGSDASCCTCSCTRTKLRTGMRMVTELASRVSPFFPTSGHSGITSSRKSIWKDTWTRTWSTPSATLLSSDRR